MEVLVRRGVRRWGCVGQRLEQRRQSTQLLHMQFGKSANTRLTKRCQHQPDHPPVTLVSVPLDEPQRLNPGCQLDHAVLTHQQVFRNLADGWATGVAVALHGQ